MLAYSTPNFRAFLCYYIYYIMYSCELNCIGLRNQRVEVVALMSRISIERDHNICQAT